MKITRGYVFRMYPSEEQIKIIEKSFGCSRYIYNYFLSKNNNYINAYSAIKELPNLVKENKWLSEVDSCLLRCSIFNLEDSFKRCKSKLSEKPKYKSKNKSKKSYRTNNITSTYKGKTYNSISVDMQKRIIKLPKLKEIEIRGYRKIKEIKGRIINATVTKEANKYYVSICVEEEKIIPTVIPTKIVGIDLGIKNLVITSDGETIENKKLIEKYERKIKGLNRWLSRSKVGSKNRYKIKIKLQVVYKKLRNARKYLIHNISNKLIKENDIIISEKLNINKMVKEKYMGKQIYNASWNELIQKLEYKSKWKGKVFKQVDTYYPSSQICSICDYQNKKIKDLSIREYECPKCHNRLDRDINASINIMFEGLKEYMRTNCKSS